MCSAYHRVSQSEKGLDIPRTTRNCELVLIRAPAYVRRSTVDAQQDECRLPNGRARQCILRLCPDIRVSVLRAGNDTVRVRSPVDGSYSFIVLMGCEEY